MVHSVCPRPAHYRARFSVSTVLYALSQSPAKPNSVGEQTLSAQTPAKSRRPAARWQRRRGTMPAARTSSATSRSSSSPRSSPAEAARAAALSTRWRGTPLRLDDLELPAATGPSIARAAAAAGAPWAGRADAVALALASHPGPVERFRLARVPAAEAWFQDLAAGVHRAREVSVVCPPEWCNRALADPLLASPHARDPRPR
jgi:hypothetical protein